MFDLGALLEFSTRINATHDLQAILSHFLLTIMGKILSQRGIVLLEKLPGRFEATVVKGCSHDVLPPSVVMTRLPERILYLDSVDGRKRRWVGAFRNAGISFVVPLNVGGRMIGVAGFGPRVISKRLDSKAATYVKSMANIAAAAIDKELIIDEVRGINRRLDGKVQELNTLFDLSREFNGLLDTERIVRLLTFTILGQLGVNRYAIALKHKDRVAPVASRLDKDVPGEWWNVLAQLTETALASKLPSKFPATLTPILQDAGAKVLVPLRIHNETRGVIAVGDKLAGQPFSQPDIELLVALGNLAITSLENARLFQEAIEKQRMEDELLIAKEIQRGLLPAELPAIPGFTVAATSLSSKHVGGDYYDVIPMGQDRVVIAIGDVSGKGTPAALLMANLQAAIRALVPLNILLTELTSRVNNLLTDNTSSGRFVTFFWGILDASQRTLTYVNAGHNPPYLFHQDGSFERLMEGGLILGVMKLDKPYSSGCIRFNDGDVLVLFTDGVSEAMNAEGVEFGESALEEGISFSLSESPGTIVDRIVEKVRRHSEGVTQSDDITMLVLKRE